MYERLTRPPLALKELAKKCFPAYTGRRYFVVTRETLELNSHWEGGSRDYFAVISLKGSYIAPESGTPYLGPLSSPPVVTLGPECMVLVHRFVGTHQSIVLYIHPDCVPNFPLLEG